MTLRVKELFFPTAHYRQNLKYFTPNLILTHLITGYEKFGSYFMKFNIITDSSYNCKYQESNQSVKFVLFDFPIFERKRFWLNLLLSVKNRLVILYVKKYTRINVITDTIYAIHNNL